MIGRVLEPLVIVLVICIVVYANLVALKSINESSSSYMTKHIDEWTDYQKKQFMTRWTFADPNDEMTEELDRLTQKYVKQARETYDMPHLGEVKVTHGLKSKGIRAVAWHNYIDGKLVNMITYNYESMKSLAPKWREEVVAHEVAHIVAFHIEEGDVGHGDKWFKHCKRLMPAAGCTEKI